jgi:hypothetical protein
VEGRLYAYRNLEDDGRMTVARYVREYWPEEENEPLLQFRVYNPPSSQFSPGQWRWGSLEEEDVTEYVRPLRECQLSLTDVPPDE